MRSRGITILELLVTLALITILVALIFPAVQRAREGARSLQCRNHLRQIGLALHRHHDTTGHLPCGWQTAPSGETAWGWATRILPMLEQSEIAAAIDRQYDVDAVANQDVSSQQLPVLLCPSDSGPSHFAMYIEGRHPAAGATADGTDHANAPDLGPGSPLTLPRSNYVGIFGNQDPDESPESSGEGTFLGNMPVRWRDLTRGLSYVAIVGERTARRLPATWMGVTLNGEDAVARLTAHAFRGPNAQGADECELDSRHVGGINVLFADGHVQHVDDQIDQDIYQSMARRR